ncbi:50S ribosomal protein L10 [Buchnera aphidicola (Tetraneura ulmi)]|uniref:50S ribosomal protein L10 n=1 Tax=Buchnera aphidicola TaxID=9 RepID=UPI003463A49D
MVLNIKEKKIIISEIRKITKKSISIVVGETKYIKSNEINELRKEARKSGVIIKIIRNTLFNIAIKDTNYECLKNFISGPILIAYSMEHPGSAARLLINFSKKNNNFKITNAVFEKKILTLSQIKKLSEIPTYKELIIKLLSVMKESSIGKLVRTLNNINKKNLN